MEKAPLPEIKKTSRWLLPSLIWIVPLAAALVGLSLAIQAIVNQGPMISITFSSAEGITPGKTMVKFKDVDVGEVKSVRLAPDLKNIIVEIRLAKEAGAFADADSKFWVVRPRLSAGNVSGLGTLLSGPYISVDIGKSGRSSHEFIGLDEPPLVQSDQPGRRFVLSAADIGSLDINAPILFRRLVVGRIENIALRPDGRMIDISIWIEAPYDRYVRSNTRFWQASGVDVKLDANGFQVDAQSLTTILLGGVAFGAPDSATDDKEVKEGRNFTLSANRDEAFKKPDGPSSRVVMFFSQSVRGLKEGAPVDFRGIELGYVRSVGMMFDREQRNFIVRVEAELFPSRLNDAGLDLPLPQQDERRREILSAMVKHGLRAQLRSGSLLTGQLYVALDFFPNAEQVEIDSAAADPIVLPTVYSELEELQQRLMGIMAKIEKIPFDELGVNLNNALASLDGTLKSVERIAATTDRSLLPEIRAVMTEARKTMEALNDGAASDSPMQQDLRQTMRSVTELSRSLKALSDSLERNPESLIRGRQEGTSR